MRILVLVFIFVVTVGVIALRSQWHQQWGPTVPYKNAGRSLPVLEALAQEHVTFLRVQDWCRAYSDNRERRASDLAGTCTLEWACSTPTAGCDNYQPFDNTSEKRFVELKSKLEDLPYDVLWIEVDYGPDGAPRAAELAVDTVNPFRRDSLIYDPGYRLPRDIPGEIINHRIDANWYYRWEDWN